MTNTHRIAGVAVLAIASIAFAQDGAPPPRGPGEGQAPNGPRQGGGRGGDPAQLVERMMQQDANGDGKLTRDEVQGQFAERGFDRADANKDGSVERTELEAFAKEFGAARAGQGAQGGQAGPGGGRGAAAGGAPSMEGAMKQANAALRTLRSSALDGSTLKADLDAVQRLQMGLVGSKAGIASLAMSDAAKAKFGDDRAAYEREFRKMLLASILMSFEVEQAILEGDGGRAKATLEKLHASEETGHALFQREESGEKQERGAEGGASGDGDSAERPRGRGGRGNRPTPPPES